MTSFDGNLSVHLSPHLSDRDVDNSRKLGKLPGCERDFPAIIYIYLFNF